MIFPLHGQTKLSMQYWVAGRWTVSSSPDRLRRSVIVSAIFRGNGVAFYPRPNLTGAPLELYGSGYPRSKIFNKAAFVAAPAGQQGNFGRNVLRGFDATQADIALQRQFHLTEQLSLRFRSEFFNIFNHPNFGPPNNSLTDPLFG